MSRERRVLAGLLAGAALLSFSGQFDHALWTPDEPRVAEVGRAMLESGDYLVPRLGGVPFLEKPPLYWWVQALGYRVFGVSDGAARLPSAVFAFLSVLLTYDMARRLAGRKAGLLAACALTTTVCFHHMHRASTDPALVFFVALGYWAFQRAALRPGRAGAASGVDGRWLLLVYLAGGLAFLSKGVVALVLLFGPLGLYVVLTRRWSLLRTWAHLPGALLLAALCAAWPVLLYQRGGRELLDPFWIDNVVQRFLSTGDGVGELGHKRPATYYLSQGLPELLPWLLVLPGLWLALWRERRTPRSLPEGLGFFVLALPAGLLLLSIPGTKRSLYLLPLLAPMAVSVGVWLAHDEQREPGDRDRWTGLGLRAILVLAQLLLGALALAGAGLLALRAGLRLDLDPLLQRALDATPALVPGLLLCAAALSLCGLRRGLRRRGPSATAAAAGFSALVLTVNLLGYRLADPSKDLRPFVRMLVEQGVLDGPLVGFRLDETSLALLPFYAGRTVESIEESEQLLARLRDEPATRVLVLERRMDRLPPEITAQLPLLVQWAISESRSYRVYGEPSDGPAGEGRDER